MDRKTPAELQEHMLWTYYGLRVGLAVIALALPVVLVLAGGLLHGVWVEPSISHYYHTNAKIPFFTTRDLFAGGLISASACLYLYKGFSTKENIALNLAGIFAIFVALLPTAAIDSEPGLISKLHAASAVLFFLSIAYVSLFRSRDTLSLLPEAKRPYYARRYLTTGIAMVVSPLAAVALSFVVDMRPDQRFRTTIFWVETLAVWAFGAYWIVKTFEMRESDAERRTLEATLKRDVVSAAIASARADRAADLVVPNVPANGGAVERVIPAVPPGAAF